MKTILVALLVSYCVAIQAQSNRLGIGTDAPEKDVHILSSGSNAELLIAPKDLSNGDTATILLSEDHDGTFGMGMRYDGQDDVLRFFGKRFSTIYPAHLSISRTTGNIGINKEIGNTQLDVDGTIRTSDLGGSGTIPVYTNNDGDLIKGSILREMNISPVAFQTGVSSNPSQSIATQTYISSGSGQLWAPIDLPVGSKISRITVYYQDNNPTGDLLIRFWTVNMSNGALAYNDIGTSSGSSSTIKSFSILPTLGNYLTNESHSIQIQNTNGDWNGSTMLIKGAKIEYTTP